MANREHLNILNQGAVNWNKWRLDNPMISPNLSQAHLAGQELTQYGELQTGSSHLQFYYVGADFSSVNLSKANLSNALLTNADFSMADLRGANFGGARLSWADFSGAKLDGADFTDSIMAQTGFGDVDLRYAQGLDAVQHVGPSTIGIDTIYASKGNISERFLRGAGVPENLITFMRSLTGQAFDFYSCFISYSSKDHQFAERLHSDLQSKGVRCWFAPEDLIIGAKLRPSFDEAIRLHDKLMVLLSEESVKSSWVEKEVETAFEHERQQDRIVLFPLRLDDAVMETKHAWAADIQRTRHIGDFRDWKNHDLYKRAFDRLLRDLQIKGEADSAAKL